MSRCVYDDKYFQVVAPEFPLNCRDDGGHLILIKKEKVTDFSSVKFLGSNKKQVFTYQITVRNNKKEKVRMLLKDQYPISSSKDIEEELLESSGASVNKDTGILTWNLELAPGESRSYRISYSVKYPKDKILNIN